MITKTFNGCAIKVKAGRGRDAWGQMTALVNGEPFPVVEKTDEAKTVAEIERHLTWVHSEPINGDRWPAHFYAPGTYEMCDTGIHPREIGGQCKHRTCQPGYWDKRSMVTRDSSASDQPGEAFAPNPAGGGSVIRDLASAAYGVPLGKTAVVGSSPMAVSPATTTTRPWRINRPSDAAITTAEEAVQDLATVVTTPNPGGES